MNVYFKQLCQLQWYSLPLCVGVCVWGGGGAAAWRGRCGRGCVVGVRVCGGGGAWGRGGWNTNNNACVCGGGGSVGVGSTYSVGCVMGLV